MTASLLDALAAQTHERRRYFCHRRRDGPVRRRNRHGRSARRDGRPRRAFRPAGRAGARRIAPGAVGRGRGARFCRARSRRPHRRRHPQSRRPANGTVRWSPTRSPRSAFPCSARCRAKPRSPCRNGISGWCRPASTPILHTLIDRLAATAERHIDLDAVVAAAAPLAMAATTSAERAPAVPPPGQRIALASDRAFTFVYPHLVDAWRNAGAEIIALLAARRRSRRPSAPIAAGCRAVIRSCMPIRLPRHSAFRMACGASPKRGRCMASAAAIWCWAKAWKTPPANGTP